MDTVAIKGNSRSDFGKSATKNIRRNGQVPCVIYGGEEIVHFSAAPIDFKSLIYTADFKLAEIELDGKKYKCFLKDAQFHPVSDDLLHIDFIELIDGKSINLELPVRFKGAAPGVKTGGKLYQKLRSVKVKTTPEHLVDQIVMDVSSLELGQSIRVRDIEELEGIAIMSSPGIPVASVEVPRALRSAAAGEEGEEEGEEEVVAEDAAE